MNRDEKNLQTRQKIIDSAFLEFSKKNFGEASLNIICSTGNLSKGIVYHYFKDKDELYLYCVKECMEELTNYLARVVMVENTSIEGTLEKYFDARISFFEAHPLYLKLFYNTLICPPPHLRSEICEIREGLDALNVSVMTGALEGVKFCSGITINEVVDIFREYQDFVNTRFQLETFGESTLKEHEDRCRLSLRIMLYGVIEREEIR